MSQAVINNPASVETLMCLIGEQPIPNLLPILHLRPKQVVLVVTAHPGSIKVANALMALMQESDILAFRISLTKEYSIEETFAELIQLLAEQSLSPTCINLTGGTKAMALAAFQLAQMRNLPIYYLESNQRSPNQLYQNTISERIATRQRIETIKQEITLEQFIRAFGYKLSYKEPSDLLEQVVCKAIEEFGLFEMKTGIQIDAKKNTDIDIMLRHGNSFAMIEVKKLVWDEVCDSCRKEMKPKPKQALEQIVTISEQRLFGTYTIRLAVFHCKENQQDRLDGIREMANLLNAKFILLHDPYDSGVLSQKDHERLRHGLSNAFGLSGDV